MSPYKCSINCTDYNDYKVVFSIMFSAVSSVAFSTDLPPPTSLYRPPSISLSSMALALSAVTLAIIIAQEQVYGLDKESYTHRGSREDGRGYREYGRGRSGEYNGEYGGGHGGGYSRGYNGGHNGGYNRENVSNLVTILRRALTERLGRIRLLAAFYSNKPITLVYTLVSFSRRSKASI